MKHALPPALAAACACTVVLLATPVHAQSRVFVGAQGSDANPCTFAAPCGTFQHAHDVVAAGGEIDVLDPAGYGILTITKEISIQGHGFAGMAAPGGTNAITINAGTSDRINLRGLLIDGLGTGIAGIYFHTGSSLNVQDCLIRNFAHGIYFAPAGASGQLFVSDTLLSDNRGAGVYVAPGGTGTTTASLSRVEVDHNKYGVDVVGFLSTGTLYVTVADSMVAGNSNGIKSSSESGYASTAVMVRNSFVVDGGIGVEAWGTGIIRLDRSTVSGNSSGWTAYDYGMPPSYGTVSSYGNNSIDDNAGNQGAPPSIPLK